MANLFPGRWCELALGFVRPACSSDSGPGKILFASNWLGLGSLQRLVIVCIIKSPGLVSYLRAEMQVLLFILFSINFSFSFLI